MKYLNSPDQQLLQGQLLSVRCSGCAAFCMQHLSGCLNSVSSVHKQTYSHTHTQAEKNTYTHTQKGAREGTEAGRAGREISLHNAKLRTPTLRAWACP